ncbi:MAG: Mlr5572 protein, partial [uncultured Rubrobacteraceae bacterium]
GEDRGPRAAGDGRNGGGGFLALLAVAPGGGAQARGGDATGRKRGAILVERRGLVAVCAAAVGAGRVHAGLSGGAAGRGGRLQRLPLLPAARRLGGLRPPGRLSARRRRGPGVVRPCRHGPVGRLRAEVRERLQGHPPGTGL